jgi:hypothetical protein
MRGQVCRLPFLLAFASIVILGFESRKTRDHILLPQIQVLGSLYIVSYVSQYYGGGIRTHLHMG